MATFELYGKFDIKNKNMTINKASILLEESLSKHYQKVSITTTGVNINGPFKPWYCFCKTNADVKFSIENNQLLYRADGTCKLSEFTYVWGILGILPVAILKFFLTWFIFDVIEFFINKDKPKRVLAEALQAVEFEVINLSESDKKSENENNSLWGFALNEYEGESRKKDLYAKIFAESEGNEQVTKAKYIKKRVEELLKEEELKSTKDAWSDEAGTEKETEKNSHFDAKCPNCQSLILKTSIICSKCKANFNDDSSWKPTPL